MTDLFEDDDGIGLLSGDIGGGGGLTTSETQAFRRLVTPGESGTDIIPINLGLELTVLGADAGGNVEAHESLLGNEEGNDEDGDSDPISIRPAEDEYGKEDPGGGSSIAEASFNFINSIVGAGMIGIPFALKEAGLVMGIFLLILVGFLTDYSIALLIRSGLKSGQELTYQDLVLYSLGSKGMYALIAAQFLFPFAAMISYSIIVGQMYPSVFHEIFGETALNNRYAAILLMTFTFMLPLAMKSELEGLARWSALAIFGVLYLGVALLISGQSVDSPSDRGEPFTIIKPNIAQAIGVMATAYVCHHNSFLVYQSLKNASEKRFAKVTHISIGVSFLLMTTVGAAGYWPFGDATEANVLDNFPEDDKVIVAGRVFYGITVMLTYPIECFVCREVIANTFCRGSLTRVQHIGITLGICMTVLAIALATNDLGIVLQINGVVCANILAFILPSACTISFLRNEGKLFTKEAISPTLLHIFGLSVLIIGFTLVVIGDQ